MSDLFTLYGYFGSDAVNADEFDGGGVNLDPAVPLSVDHFESFRVMVMVEEMQAVFSGCADLVIPCEQDTVIVPSEKETIMVREAA